MEFIKSIDFTIVALIICFLYELLGKPFTVYMLATTGQMKKEDIGYSNCLIGLFYIVFIFIMLWNSILWLPALLLIVLGFITGGVTRPPLQRVKELLVIDEQAHLFEIHQQTRIAQIYWTIDKALSVCLLGWMVFLHLQFLGIIA